MKLKNLFFHIHYCNCRQLDKKVKYSARINKTIQHHELFFVTNGKGHIKLPNKTYELKEGNLLYLCPNIPHTITIDSVEPICFFSVHFSYAIVGFDNTKWDIKQEADTLPLDSVQSLKDHYIINNLFKKLVGIWMEKPPNYEFISKTLFQELLFEIFQNLKNNNDNYSASLKVDKVINYMLNNINNKITLKELSLLVSLSPTYLSKIFKETTGYSVIEFFNKIKVDKAKELIVDGDKKIKEVSKLLGFSDEFYFSRIFKKVEGISPLDFYHKNVHEY
jgi:YesN/AraC family two-component response regulator